LQRKWRDNLGTAALALILALTVWVNATYQADKPREDFFPEQIRIQVLGAPQDLVVINEPAEFVRIKLKAFSSSWNTLTSSDFSVTADWSDLTEGLHTVPIKVICSDKTTTIVSVSPEMVYVRLELAKKNLKAVAVDLQDRDEVPLGYRVYSPDVTPEFITVSGPASAVDRVAKLLAPLSLINQKSSLERIIEPIPVDEYGNLVDGVNLSPQTVSVSVKIEKKQNYREVVVRARTAGQPARGYFVIGVNVLPATVTVVGPPDTIDAMGGLIDIKGAIDVTGATRMLAEKFDLQLPEGVTLLGGEEGEGSKVLVTVGIDAVTGGTTVELPLKSKKLRLGYVAQLSVPMVDVILTGPAVLLDELQTDLLDAYVDLTALGVGTHRVRPIVDILVDQDSQLRDLVVKNISPEYIEVTISLPPTNTPTPTMTITPTPTIAATATITATQAIESTLTPGTATPETTVHPTDTVTPQA